MDLNSQFSILNSVSRLAFFQPIAVLAAARYCGAETTYSLLSPKISNASSRIGRSSYTTAKKCGRLHLVAIALCLKALSFARFSREILGVMSLR